MGWTTPFLLHTTLTNQPCSLGNEDVGLVHDADLRITSRVGLHTMLEEIGRNHGFQADVVNEVYRNSNGLQETDNILHVMREVAQE